MGKKLSLVVGCFALLAAPDSWSAVSAAKSVSFYVDPVNGDNSKDGKSESTAFLTIEQAQKAVRAINKTMTGNIYVYLRGGTYRLKTPITFNSSDSGNNGYIVYYKSYPNSTPVISGGSDLTSGWSSQPDANGVYSRKVGQLHFRQLYVANQPAIRARTPNRTNTDTFGPYYRTTDVDRTAKQYLIRSTQIARWSNLSQVEMVVQPHWYHNRLRIFDFKVQNDTAYVSFKPLESGYAFAKTSDEFYQGNSFHFENSRSLLDAEGEWYLDTGTQTLYYKPRAGEVMGKVSVVAGNLETLFNVEGTASSKVHDLEFQGLVFQHTDWKLPGTNGLVATQGVQPSRAADEVAAAIKVSYGVNVRIIDNTIRNLGGDGIQFVKGVTHSEIVGNHFRYIAANAIRLDVLSQKAAAPVDRTSRILVANNDIARVGQTYTNGMGVMASYISDSIIEHNEISYGPYSGMQIGNQTQGADVGMRNNKIRYNDVHHVMQLHDDGGGIYTLGYQEGTHVFENWVHDIQRSPWAMNYPVAAIYLDNYSEKIRVEHNVIQRNVTDIFQQKGAVAARNNVLVNNVAQAQAVTDKAGVVANYVEP